ncbi:hypothetical protein ABKQ09_09365 [Bacillus atrophaeus]|uniref:hypothetical protein n=1 Tax=Bacillus atrophaeus TaxID=1452 RepID=UPI0035276C4F
MLGSKIKSLSNRLPILFLLCFPLPIILSSLFVLLFREILHNEFFSDFLVICGFLFTSISLLLVFILYNKYSHMDFVKNKTAIVYLNGKAKTELIQSLEDIGECISKGNVTNTFKKSCLNVLHIYELLCKTEGELYLKPYRPEIKNLVSLINKNKLVSEELIHLEGNKNKEVIERLIYDLLMYLERMKEGVD